MTTLYDVANYSGVSKSTVSLVLNNSPLVKDSTRQKVLEAMEALSYVPNNNARGLTLNKTHCLGIVIMHDRQKSVSYDFDQHTGLCSYNITTGIMNGLINTEYGALIESFCSIENPGVFPNLVRNNRVDGVFIVGSPYDSEMIQKLKDKIPTVMVGVDSYESGIDSVKADPGDGVRIGFDYLFETGHRNILFMNSPTALRSSSVRLKAYIQCLKEKRIEFKEEMVVNCSENNGKSAYEQIEKIWKTGLRPDAILAANGPIAMGAMRYLTEIGVKIPDDISVFSYEDSTISGYSIPPLSTVNIHKELMGETAVKCMMEKLENPEKKVCVITVPCDIVVRGSVKKRL